MSIKMKLSTSVWKQKKSHTGVRQRDRNENKYLVKEGDQEKKGSRRFWSPEKDSYGRAGEQE